jgi:hypothetical protein
MMCFVRYLVNYLGPCTKAPNAALVMELMPGVTLANFLASNKDLSWSIRLAMAEDIAKGIQVLHDNIPIVCLLDFFSNFQ